MKRRERGPEPDAVTGPRRLSPREAAAGDRRGLYDALAGRVVLIDLGEQLVDQVLGLDLAQHLALRVDRAGVLGAGNPEVGVASLADAVDRAAEHGDLD